MLNLQQIISTKTPIWTGNLNGETPSIKLTGIIGSIRTWSEAIFRGLGYSCCDPNSDNSCPNREKYYCIVCLFFGSTGWRRPFKIRVSGGEQIFDGNINVRPHKTSKRNRGWYLGGGIYGKLDLKIVKLNPDFNPILMKYLLKLISQLFGLGARLQLGYGIIDKIFHKIEYQKFMDELDHYVNSIQMNTPEVKLDKNFGNHNMLPNLKHMFFTKIRFDTLDQYWWKEVDGLDKVNNKDFGKLETLNKNNNVIISPAIKNWLRYGKRGKWKLGKNKKNQDISPFVSSIKDFYSSNWFFGFMFGNSKSSSKINITNAYKIKENTWECRIWGWIPEETPRNFNRQQFLADFYSSLNGNGISIPWDKILGKNIDSIKLISWREFNSERDTKGQFNDMAEFLRSIGDE